MSFFSKFEQNVRSSTNNSSNQNLDASATFTGTSESTLGVAGIQVSLKTDQNCTIYIDQSPDGINWDLTDSYEYLYSIANFGVTVQAMSSYLRVRVTNLSSTTATTYFRLQTALCPIVEALPRSLDDSGYLKVGIKGISDSYGFGVENTPIGEMRVAIPTRLIGAHFDGAGNGGTVDSNFWTSAVVNASSISQANSRVTLSSGTNAAGSAKLYTTRRARYVSATGLSFRAIIQTSAGTVNNTRRWGIAYGSNMAAITDGAYFQWSGTTFGIRIRKTNTETVAYAIDSGSFNGDIGATYDPGLTVKTYEIYWTNSKVIFVVGDEVLHTITASSDTWSDTMNHHIYMDNINSGAVGGTSTLECRVASIRRLGHLLTQPTSYYHANGTTTGLTLKYGAGNLHSMSFQSLNNSVITLSDSTSAATPPLYATTGVAAITQPLTIDFKGLPFYSGLRLTVSGANSQATIVYE